MKYDDLSIRMKKYEEITDHRLIDRMPVIIRLDGRAFHTFTKGFQKPFDQYFNEAMQSTMKQLCENISNCIFGYTQSDEITLVLYPKTIDTQPWFDNRIQKIVSSAASMATLFFNRVFTIIVHNNELFSNYAGDSMPSDMQARRRSIEKGATFDARVFNIPKEEVINNIIWRQQDATKNSISALAQANFSHKQLQGKNTSDMQDMLMLEKGINWNDIPTKFKRGSACVKALVHMDTPNGSCERHKWIIDNEMPIITQNRDYINSLFEE